MENNGEFVRPEEIQNDSKKRRRIEIIPLQDKICSNINYFHPEVRQRTDFLEIKSDLDKLGFAVVGNILEPSEIESFESSFWEAVSNRVPSLLRNDISTWTAENTVWRGSYGAGQFKHYGMAQEQHCWQIRLNPGIRRIFQDGIFDGEECCVSIDGAAAIFSPTQSGLELHVDLVPGLPGFECGSMQGAYSVYNVEYDKENGKAGAGFVCVPGSHKLYDEIWSARIENGKYKYPEKHFAVLEKESPLQMQTSLILSPENSLIIWDSRLLHRNYGGDFTAEELERPCRLTQFITWHPKKFRSEKSLQKKIENVLEGKCGNHWAALAFTEPIKPFPPWGKHTVKTLIPFGNLSEVPDNILKIL